MESALKLIILLNCTMDILYCFHPYNNMRRRLLDVMLLAECDRNYQHQHDVWIWHCYRFLYLLLMRL